MLERHVNLLYRAHSDGMDDDSEPVHNNNSTTTNHSGMSQLQEATSSGDALTLEALTRGMQFRSDIAAGESPVLLALHITLFCDEQQQCSLICVV
jgi:hypothetical protein